MFRTTDFGLTAVMIAAAAITYTTKHQAENRLSDIRQLEQQIRFEEDTLTILKADWSLLTQPSRLQGLAEAYQDELALRPTEAHQIVGLDQLPSTPVEPEGVAGVDAEIVTGGVRR